ncbi:MAG: hypothetical protein G01um101438_790 [Parcubacteria group bacterium Gr01-1014_38]|nr:MAG: hypothetical protein G01um101438_790 [Parcubacteria group bacterium Gr01-1014_38]
MEETSEAKKRPAGNMENYEKDGDQWRCRDCRALILATKVTHPIHAFELPGAGLGRCQYTIVPYCPNCETKPEFHGRPLEVPFVYLRPEMRPLPDYLLSEIQAPPG